MEAELKGSPEPIVIDPSATAFVVFDMQNGYASSGGYIDKAGFDITPAANVTKKIKSLLPVARSAGMRILYLLAGWENVRDAGGPGSPIWHKSNALRLMRKRPQLDGKLLIKGTWDYAVIDELTPEADDLVISRPRYSGFFGSHLDMTLRGLGFRNLIFSGISINVGIESTIRDGLCLDYFCILLEDAAMHAGPPCTREASLYNIETFHGWVSRADDFVSAFGSE